jgi:nitroreductase
MDMNETIKLLLSRRSIRSYKQDQLSDEELQTILKAGMFAPSAMNQQLWHFTAVQNKEMLHKINVSCKNAMLKSGVKALEERAKSPDFSVLYNAPTLIIVSCDTKAIAPQNDCTLALQNMFLAAESLDIGSCWIHAIPQILNSENGVDMKKDLGIPEGYNLYCSGAFGYKTNDSPDAPQRNENVVNFVR